MFRWSSPSATRTSTRCCAGQTGCDACACGPTPTLQRTRARRASWGPDCGAIWGGGGGRRVTIRLPAPPLHEFLPDRGEVQAEVERARIEQSDDLPALERLLERVHALAEVNPMLGTRGCRLGILYP